MNKNGFIFDLDGVIVDTAKYHFKAWKSLADELGIHFDETLNEELKGVSRADSLHKILNWGGLTISEDEFNAFLVSKNEDYLTYIDNMNVNEILPFSYLNYIRIGEIIYMPINKFTNERKKIEIRNIFKNSDVRFILCNSLLNEKGGLHCFSMNIIKDKEI